MSQLLSNSSRNISLAKDLSDHLVKISFVNDPAQSSRVFNSQPHIDELKIGIDRIVENSQREEGICYALPHRHYTIAPDEMIIAERRGNTHITYVDRISDVTKAYEPCMWYPQDGVYYAVMFSASPLSSPLKIPTLIRHDAGLMHPDYAYPWSEFTDITTRNQSFILNYTNPSLTPIVTVAWLVPAGLSEVRSSKCFANCYNDGIGEHQVGPHEPIPSVAPDRDQQETRCYANCYNDGIGEHQVGPHEPIPSVAPDRD
jgi:hypothetical protein